MSVGSPDGVGHPWDGNGQPMTTGPLSQPLSLRTLLGEPGLLVVPGVVDPLTARIAERVGFSAVYASGAGLSNTAFGLPDIGFVNLSHMADLTRRLAAAVSLPIIVDADTGYGGPLNVMQTVRELERAGAAAIQIEDQQDPKRCGHFDGKTIRPREEMQRRVEAAVDARTGPELLIIVRTDAVAAEGIESALARCLSYVDAGADVIFVEAPETVEDLRAIPPAVPVPTLVNMVEGGKTPLHSSQELEAWGYRIALFANLALRVSAYAVAGALRHLLAEGGSQVLLSQMLTWEERQALVDLDDFIELEKRYGWLPAEVVEPAP